MGQLNREFLSMCFAASVLLSTSLFFFQADSVIQCMLLFRPLHSPSFPLVLIPYSILEVTFFSFTCIEKQRGLMPTNGLWVDLVCSQLQISSTVSPADLFTNSSLISNIHRIFV